MTSAFTISSDSTANFRAIAGLFHSLRGVIADIYARIGQAESASQNSATRSPAENDGLITTSFDGQGAAVTADSWIMVRMPYDGTIDGAYLTGDGQTGSAVVDVRRDTRANIPPTGADSICAAAKPTISSAKYADDTTLTGWSTTFAAGDALIVYVESCATFQKLELQLTVVRT